MNKKKTATTRTPKRKAIPKKTRFEILKRDSFTCQYCGRKSPDVVLNIDHITPVASGGTNAMSNLITSCFDCNSGKGKRELSDDTIVAKQRAELELQQERVNQIKLMSEWQTSLLNVGNATVDAINDIIIDMSGIGMSKRGKLIAKSWVKKHDVRPLMEATVKSFEQYFIDDDSWGKAFDMIPRIASILSQPEWKQSAIKYNSYAKINGYNHSDTKLFSELTNNYADNISGLDFESIFEGGMNLRQYCEAIMFEAQLEYER